MITNAENSRLNGPATFLVSILKLESIQYFLWDVRCVQENISGKD